MLFQKLINLKKTKKSSNHCIVWACMSLKTWLHFWIFYNNSLCSGLSPSWSIGPKIFFLDLRKNNAFDIIHQKAHASWRWHTFGSTHIDAFMRIKLTHVHEHASWTLGFNLDIAMIIAFGKQFFFTQEDTPGKPDPHLRSRMHLSWKYLELTRGLPATNLCSLLSTCVSHHAVTGGSSEALTYYTRSYGRCWACSWSVWWYLCGHISGPAVLSATRGNGKYSRIAYDTACFGSPTSLACLYCCPYCAHSYAWRQQTRKPKIQEYMWWLLTQHKVVETPSTYFHVYGTDSSLSLSSSDSTFRFTTWCIRTLCLSTGEERYRG